MLDLKGTFFSSGLELISHKKKTIVKNSQMTEVSPSTFAIETFVNQQRQRRKKA